MSSQLGQLAPLVEDTNLVAVWLSHLPLRDRLTVSRVCSGLCKKVRAAVATKLAFKEREGEAATATPSSRAFTGAVHITYNVNPTFTSYRAMAALLRYAADTWPYVTSVTLDIHYECPELTDNPVALMGPLQTLGLMPHLMTLSLSLPRLEGLEMEALAALTGLSRLELAAPGGGAVVRTPVHLPHPWQWSQLVGLKALSLNSFVPGDHPAVGDGLPRSLTSVTITPASAVRPWLPALQACPALQQLCIEYGDVDSEADTIWDLLWALAPHLVHLTALTLSGNTIDAMQQQPSAPQQEPPQPCFPALRSITCDTGSMLRIAGHGQWRLLAACPSLEALHVPLVAQVAPPDDLGRLGLKRVEVVLLSGGWTEAGALLRHCPLVEEVVIKAHDAMMPETLPLALVPLSHLQRVRLVLHSPAPQLVEVLFPSLSTTRELSLAMPLGADGVLPDLSACCHLTKLLWTTQPPGAVAMAVAAAAAGDTAVADWPVPEDLLWSLRGCGGLVELALGAWIWYDAGVALALAGAHPFLKRLSMICCMALKGNRRSSPQQRLQRVRGLLRPGLVLKVTSA